jgi:hypothetical protein
MNINPTRSSSLVSRRTALAGLGAGGVGVALGAPSSRAQEMSTAEHPLTGMWLAMANPARAEDPKFPAPSLFAADGTVILGFVPAEIGMDGNIQSGLAHGCLGAVRRAHRPFHRRAGDRRYGRQADRIGHDRWSSAGE